MKIVSFVVVLCLLWICETRHLTGCRDIHVWIADGDVNCKYLYTPSFYGLHRRPEYFCTKYPLTYCCDTCTDMGFGKKPKSNAVTTTTPASTTKYVPKVPAPLNVFEVILQSLEKPTTP